MSFRHQILDYKIFKSELKYLFNLRFLYRSTRSIYFNMNSITIQLIPGGNFDNPTGLVLPKETKLLEIELILYIFIKIYTDSLVTLYNNAQVKYTKIKLEDHLCILCVLFLYLFVSSFCLFYLYSLFILNAHESMGAESLNRVLVSIQLGQFLNFITKSCMLLIRFLSIIKMLNTNNGDRLPMCILS